MAEKVIIDTECDQCHNQIESDQYIQFPEGDLDSHGIWFGLVRQYLWFHDEKFCSFTCFASYVWKWFLDARLKQTEQTIYKAQVIFNQKEAEEHDHSHETF